MNSTDLEGNDRTLDKNLSWEDEIKAWIVSDRQGMGRLRRGRNGELQDWTYPDKGTTSFSVRLRMMWESQWSVLVPAPRAECFPRHFYKVLALYESLPWISGFNPLAFYKILKIKSTKRGDFSAPVGSHRSTGMWERCGQRWLPCKEGVMSSTQAPGLRFLRWNGPSLSGPWMPSATPGLAVKGKCVTTDNIPLPPRREKVTLNPPDLTTTTYMCSQVWMFFY